MVEIGCIEMIGRVMTGATFHCYFNPSRAMPAGAEAVHGLSDRFLSDKPVFAQKAGDLLEFLGDSPLVAHNAPFDFGFLNSELGRCGRPAIDMGRMIDTIAIAKVRHPGSKMSLDALQIIALAPAIRVEAEDHAIRLADVIEAAHGFVHADFARQPDAGVLRRQIRKVEQVKSESRLGMTGDPLRGVLERLLVTRLNFRAVLGRRVDHHNHLHRVFRPRAVPERLQTGDQIWLVETRDNPDQAKGWQRRRDDLPLAEAEALKIELSFQAVHRESSTFAGDYKKTEIEARVAPERYFRQTRVS